MDLEETDLDNLIIKDKEYYRKRRNKILIIISIILVIIAIVIVTILLLLKKRGGKIICIYRTTKENENIKLINADDNISFSLIINNKSFSKNNSHIFEKPGLHNVTFHFKNKLESLDHLFFYLDNLIEIDFSQLETEKVISFAYVLNYCRNLTKVNFDNKTPNLKNMEYMFAEAYEITTLNIKLDTSKVTRMDLMFYYVEKIKSLDLSNFEFDNLINATSMFEYCSSLKEIKFNENIRAYNLQRVFSMFGNCFSLEYLNTQIFKSGKLLGFSNVFQNCHSLKEIDISNLDLSAVNSIDYVFNGCFNLKSVNISNLKINHLLISTENAFSNCRKLTSLDLSSFNLSHIIDASNMFNNCTDLKYVELPNKILSIHLTNYMFENCYNLKSLNLGFLENAQNWSFAYGMFKNCKSLKNIKIPNVTTYLLGQVGEMFSGCTDLETIDFKQLETLNILNMSWMFYQCEKLKHLDLSKFNTKKVRKVTGVLDGVPRNVNIIINESITGENFLLEIQKLKEESILSQYYSHPYKLILDFI